LFLGGIVYLIYKNKEGKARHIKTLEQLNAQLQQQKDEIGRMNTILQLKNLRAQMNPHFIFNCMSSIQECILLGQVDDANRYLTRLSRLLRMVLLYADEESISLDKELQMLDLYLQLESVRLKRNFEYKIEVDENIFTEEIQVPTLILQPFAENAIWHGLQHKESDRKLLIKITAEKNLLYCVIQDNGVGRAKASQMMQLKKHHQSKGLKIIKDRLQILQQKTSRNETGFKFIDLFNEINEPAGTKVQITLPLAG
jgi:LytS/YehU family sensor histidine kinase